MKTLLRILLTLALFALSVLATLPQAAAVLAL